MTVREGFTELEELPYLLDGLELGTRFNAAYPAHRSELCDTLTFNFDQKDRRPHPALRRTSAPNPDSRNRWNS